MAHPDDALIGQNGSYAFSPALSAGGERAGLLLNARRINLNRCLIELTHQSAGITELAGRLVSTLRAGRKLLVAGNGGSAAEAQHFTAELVGRFRLERSPYAAIALTSDTSILTAIANDYGYADVFARQVRALASANDTFIALSTSGHSENLLRGIRVASDLNIYTVAITGMPANPLTEAADFSIRVPLTETSEIQEVQGILLHILCEIIEVDMVDPEGMAADD